MSVSIACTHKLDSFLPPKQDDFIYTDQKDQFLALLSPPLPPEQSLSIIKER